MGRYTEENTGGYTADQMKMMSEAFDLISERTELSPSEIYDAIEAVCAPVQWLSSASAEQIARDALTGAARR